MHSEIDHIDRKKSPLFIHACGSNSALGLTNAQIHERLEQGFSPDMITSGDLLNVGKKTVVGRVASTLPEISDNKWNSANNRLALSALLQISSGVKSVIERYGADRVAVVAGTSTSGIADGEVALKYQMENGEFPVDYSYCVQEIGSLSEFVAAYFRIRGASYTISTACSSSGRAFISSARLIRAGMADAVVVGGADSICRLTLNGFQSLESLSEKLCNPFSKNRNGINIGEGAAFFVLARDPSSADDIALLGFGDSSDAYHISAPQPEGLGAEESMRKALDNAGLVPEDIGYVNAHGTATVLNDHMEAKAINRVFGDEVPVSSTKPLTGHALGAASAVEAAICWNVLNYKLFVPMQVNDGEYPEDLPQIRLAKRCTHLSRPTILSNSFAFGGNNVSLIFGKV